MAAPVVQITRNGATAIPASPIAFSSRLSEGLLRAGQVTTLQVNVGKLCNQACKHCHVDASPSRTEIMDRRTIDECVRVIRKHRIPVLDITGGAPELIPDFRPFVTLARGAGARRRCARDRPA